MVTASQIREYEAETNRLRARLMETFAHQDEGRFAYSVYIKAAEKWHLYNARQQAIKHLDSLQIRTEIRQGNRESIEDAICFLEADPWFLYSGNMKERLLRALKAAPLECEDKIRLRQVLLNIVRAKDQREIKSYWGLLRRVWTPEFEDQLFRETERSGRLWRLKRLQHYIRSNRASFEPSEN